MEPNRYARIGGALYLVIIVAGIVGPLVTRELLIVAHDAVATSHNIASSPGPWDRRTRGDDRVPTPGRGRDGARQELPQEEHQDDGR